MTASIGRRAAPSRATAGRRRGGAKATSGDEAIAKGMPMLVGVFLISLIIPVIFSVGALSLQPYRVVLILAFFPMARRFFMGDLRLHDFDWLIVASIGWAFLAYLANHGVRAIELGGIRTVEVLGAWMLGRVGIRNAEEMTRVVRTLFWLAMALLPFAAYEALTGRAIVLQLIPSSPRILWPAPRLGLRRAQVVFSHAILYGVFVSAAVGLVWYGFNQTASFGARAARSALLGVATIFSVSAGALLAYVMQGMLIVYEMAFKKNPNRWRLFTWAAISGYVVIDILSNRTPFHLVVQYLTFSSAAAYNRILIFRFGMDSVWAHPIFGIGLRDWVRPWWMGDSVDNFWLLNAMQFGIPGFLLFAGGFVLLLRAVIRSRLNDPVEWNLRAGWLTSMGGLIIAGGTVHYWTVMLSFVVFLFGMGGWMVRAPTAEAGAENTRAARRGTRERTASPRSSRGIPTTPSTSRQAAASATSRSLSPSPAPPSGDDPPPPFPKRHETPSRPSRPRRSSEPRT